MIEFVYDVTAGGVHSLQSIAVSTRRAIAAMGMRKAIGCTLTLGNETGMEVFQLTFSDSDAHKMVNCMNKIFGKRAGIKNTRELEDYYKSHGK